MILNMHVPSRRERELNRQHAIRQPLCECSFESYCTLTTAMTGVIMKRPFPVCLMDLSPSKSKSMVIASFAVSSN